MNTEEFRGALRALIPRLINLLDHKEALPQKKALGGLGALGEYSEPGFTTTKLI